MLNKKITNLCFFTRESDGKEILALSSKEGTIFLMEVKHIRANKKTKLSIDLTRKIWPTSSETGITSIRNYENTDYLLCTNIFGDILIYDTTNGQLMSSDRCKCTLCKFLILSCWWSNQFKRVPQQQHILSHRKWKWPVVTRQFDHLYCNKSKNWQKNWIATSATEQIQNQKCRIDTSFGWINNLGSRGWFWSVFSGSG